MKEKSSKNIRKSRFRKDNPLKKGKNYLEGWNKSFICFIEV